MKNKIILATAMSLLALVSTSVRSQNAANDAGELYRHEVGVQYMPTFVTMSFRNTNGDVIRGDVSVSHGIGFMYAYNFTENLGFQTELDYLAIAQKYKDQSLSRQVNVSYLNLPLMLSLSTNKTKAINGNFIIGPQLGFNIGSSISTSGNENSGNIQATVGAKGTDLGMAYGLSGEFALNPDRTLKLDVGYRGFFGIVKTQANQTSNNTYNVLVRGSRKANAAVLGISWSF
jgi:hypothetical protein